MNRTITESAIVLAPRGRDAAVAVSMLREGGMEGIAMADIAALVRALRGGVGFAVVTEEALRNADLRSIAQFIEEQEEWSDLPFILLTERGGGIERNPTASRLLETLGNVTFLERPFHPTTLISLAQSALRGRRRQYDARARLHLIREGQDRLRIALAAGGLGAWTYDVPSRTLDMSDDCRAHYGRQPSERFGYPDLLATIHADDRERVQDHIRHSLATGEDYDVEFRILWRDGSLHWVQMRGRVDRNDRGEAVRMIGVSHDVTERKEGEAVLRGFAAELEQRVEERTREHEAVTAQLHEAQKLETLGQLTGGVAHDFNNLLTPVLGNLDMLRRLHRDERSQRLIASALQASERARTLVSRLLAFARRQNLEARPVDPAAVVDGILDLIRRSLGPQIEIVLDVPSDLSAAMVDPNQLELALLNLAVNARDAMPDGGRLSLALSEEQVACGHDAGLKPGSYIRFGITDTGTGMDEATLRRAVEPFYSTKGVGKGTGLGLSMIHGMAAQSGGALMLRSRVGEGTIAELWLPVASSPAAIAVEPFEQPDATTRPLHILLVDDEELVRTGTADMLADMGHDVIQAASGAQALEMLRRGRVDLMVTDYLMPGMTGLDLAAEARQLHPGLPVLVITGFADVANGLPTDFTRLAKPFRQRELAGSIAHVVEAHAMA